MPTKKVKLRGDLEGVTVELDASRQITEVTKDGKKLKCRPSHAGGQVCKLVDGPIVGPDDGPVLQVHVSKSKKSLIARTQLESASGLETAMILEAAAKRGFQRHAI
jgi:hypothetical protein